MKAPSGLNALMLERVKNAGKALDCRPEFIQMLTTPISELTINFPVRLENDHIEVFSGYRVQHNNLLGPYLGGLRYHPSLDIEDVKGLALWATLQNALVDIPFGGSMGGVQINASKYSIREIEHITRRFIFALGSNIGAEYDILLPDIGTNSQIMAWALDTFVSTLPPAKRNENMHMACGKPVRLNGIQGHAAASGKGLALILSKWAKENGVSLSGSTYFLQGFGKVGTSAALALHQLGAVLIAVEDASGPITNPKGIDPADLIEYARQHRKISGYPKAKAIDHKSFMSLNADFFLPSALQNQITAATAPLLNVKLVAEGATNPTDAAGEEILKQKGIKLLPGILCNAGGAVASYFEWLQNKRSENWDEAEVDDLLERYLIAAYEKVRDMAAERNCDHRSAAAMVAVNRLYKIHQGRGLFP